VDGGLATCVQNSSDLQKRNGQFLNYGVTLFCNYCAGILVKVIQCCGSSPDPHRSALFWEAASAALE
jgi:hypothetical protein